MTLVKENIYYFEGLFEQVKKNCAFFRAQKRRIAVTKNVVKSRHTILLLRSPGGEIGRRKGLKIPRPHGRAGSIPAPGTNSMKIDKDINEIKVILKKIHKNLFLIFFIVAIFALLYFGLLIYLFVIKV